MQRTVPLTRADCLPADGCAGTLVGRAWLPGATAGPAVVAIRDDGVFDLSDAVATMSGLLERDDEALAHAEDRIRIQIRAVLHEEMRGQLLVARR